ncbi:MAG: OmpA family protein [Bacteroidota bacterium]
MPRLTAYCCLLLFFLLTQCATAQKRSAQTIADLPKKDQKLLANARSSIGTGMTTEAKQELDELLQRHPANRELYFLRSEVLKALGQYTAAAEDITAGIASGMEPARAVAYRKLGEVASLGGDFSGAVNAYQKYLELTPTSSRGDRQQKAEALLARAKIAANLAANPVPYSPRRLNDSVNTDAHLEYFPSLSIDGERLIFTRRIAGQNEDFYFSRKQTDGSWSTASPLDGINTEFDEGAQTMTADGNYLVYTVCNRPNGAGGCDLYFSEWTGELWTPARSIGNHINSRWYEAQPSISADGQLLFFTSNRPGGQGKNDLYACGRRPDGKWSQPVNVGKQVNTSGQDQYPFWSADGQTLFFTSDGHPGLGGEDLFRTVLGVDNIWSEPENLGYPINTAANETTLFVALNGTEAYFSKREVDPATGVADVDLYTFDLPPAIRPLPTTYVEANITDVVTGEPLAATVRLRPTTQDAPATVRSANPAGYFLAVLPAGKDYAFTVDHPGYLFYSDRFPLAEGFSQEKPYQLEIKLQPLSPATVNSGTEEDGATAFQNVLFATGSATLLPVSSDELDRLASLLLKAPDYQVAINGHTDDVGNDDDNQELSEQRAESVKTYLIDQGVVASRITTKGFGESRPVASNDTEEGRAKNRRTTFKLSKK